MRTLEGPSPIDALLRSGGSATSAALIKVTLAKVDYMILEDKADEVTTLLKSIANRHRLRIIRLLAEKEHSVGELEKIVGLSQSALSQHLARLRRDKMVTTRRNAQTIYYSLAGSLPRSLVDSITNVFSQYTSPALATSDAPLASVG